MSTDRHFMNFTDNCYIYITTTPSFLSCTNRSLPLYIILNSMCAIKDDKENSFLLSLHYCFCIFISFPTFSYNPFPSIFCSFHHQSLSSILAMLSLVSMSVQGSSCLLIKHSICFSPEERAPSTYIYVCQTKTVQMRSILTYSV